MNKWTLTSIKLQYKWLRKLIYEKISKIYDFNVNFKILFEGKCKVLSRSTNFSKSKKKEEV